MKKPVKKKLDPDAHKKAMEDFGKTQRQREQGYRAQALKMYPHICASCGREFSGRQLSELTVHHKDHDHTNNPPDGSNWELLCLYCHDNEHEKYLMKGHGGGSGLLEEASPSPFSQFGGLDALFTQDDNK